MTKYRPKPEDLGRIALGMADVQRHRGPDSAGVFHGDEIALSHRRLAILDLTEAGSQPMASRDGRYTIVLNGEIFNYLELRRELRGPFRSDTDTEVLIEGCAKWGIEKMLERTVGMFAFALWDAQTRTLTIARDRLGEKPLVYFYDGATFAFASEMKALEVFHSGVLDPLSVDAYLALGYVPAPMAIFRHCRKLEAGHLLRFDPATGCRVDRWWYPERVSTEPGMDGHDRAIALREKIGEAVRLRLRADVPVAVSLSGGVDSSVIAVECTRGGAIPEAFTVCFDDDHTDLPYARMVAKHLGLKHEVLMARGSGMADEFARVMRFYDEPFADSSALPSFALAQALSSRYKVVLNGDGGDEAFGGYRHYERIGLKQLVKRAAAAAGLCDGMNAGPAGVYVQSKVAFRAYERNRLLNGQSLGNSMEALVSALPYPAPTGDALRLALWTDRHLHLSNGLTYKTDIALAAFGIEGRAPFLDHRLLEWTQSLPERDLVSGQQKKILLRRVYAGDLPAEILNRRKHGFGAPVNRWLTGPLRDLLHDLVPCPLFDLKEQAGWSGQRLYSILAFAQWARSWGARW
jgi:asparagine synthase (glutamine-hydrolysing)